MGIRAQNANLKCANLNDGTAYDYRDDAWDDPSLDFGSLSGVDASYSTVAGTPLRIDWSSDSLVQVVIVKQSTVSAVYSYDDGGATSGTVYVVLPDSVKRQHRRIVARHLLRRQSEPEPHRHAGRDEEGRPDS